MFFKNFKNNWYFLACGLYITFCELNLKNSHLRKDIFMYNFSSTIKADSQQIALFIFYQPVD